MPSPPMSGRGAHTKPGPCRAAPPIQPLPLRLALAPSLPLAPLAPPPPLGLLSPSPPSPPPSPGPTLPCHSPTLPLPPAHPLPVPTSNPYPCPCPYPYRYSYPCPYPYPYPCPYSYPYSCPYPHPPLPPTPSYSPRKLSSCGCYCLAGASSPCNCHRLSTSTPSGVLWRTGGGHRRSLGAKTGKRCVMMMMAG